MSVGGAMMVAILVAAAWGGCGGRQALPGETAGPGGGERAAAPGQGTISDGRTSEGRSLAEADHGGAPDGGRGAAEGVSHSGAPGGFWSGMPVDSLIRPGEKHFRRLYQLTNGGENAEAYFSWDGKDLILQATVRDAECDQIYTIPATGGALRLVSTGTGRCTCSYFMPGDREIIFSSTHLAGPACPPKPDFSQGYVWALYDSYDVFIARRDGSGLRRLTETPGYDAEATAGPDGTIIFTSDRDGDLELYSMKPDGSNVKRLTHEPGYDGGAFFSADGRRICYRASRPAPGAELEDYQRLLSLGLIRPSRLDIYIMDADGGNKIRLTEWDAASFCPFFHPSGDKVIFTSNVHDPAGRNFDLYLVDIATRKTERISTEETFDGFPMFSPDGKRLVFASNRSAERPGETNVFMAEWVD